MHTVNVLSLVPCFQVESVFSVQVCVTSVWVKTSCLYCPPKTMLSDWVVQVSLSHAVSSFKIVFMVWECVFMLSAVTRGGPC